MKRYVLILALSWAGYAYSQKEAIKDLELQKRNSMLKIIETSKILNQTQEDTRSSLGRLNAFNNQIEQRTKIIGYIDQEVKILNDEISETTSLVAALEGDLDALKTEYAKMVYVSSKNSNSIDKMQYLFSAASMGQLFSRLQYFKQYSEERQYQIAQIGKIKKLLEEKKAGLVATKTKQASLLEENKREQYELKNLTETQKDLIAELRKREGMLRLDIKAKQSSLTELERQIRAIMEAETAKKATSTKSEAQYSAVLFSAFEKNKRRLPWPVKDGFIAGKYGKQEHALLKGVEINNLGIDIQTTGGAQVFSVFEGKVSAVTKVPGMNYMVMLQHGDFYTVYAKLKKVSVKVDQKLTAGQLLGEVEANREGDHELQFQVWKNQSKLNPEEWLLNR